MPILKFRCRTCEKEFPKIFLKPEQAPRTCPVCGADDIVIIGPAFEETDDRRKRALCMTCDSCGEYGCARPTVPSR